MSRLGRDEPPLPLPRDEGGWIHAWHADRTTDHAAGMGVIALLTLGVSYVLVFTDLGPGSFARGSARMASANPE